MDFAPHLSGQLSESLTERRDCQFRDSMGLPVVVVLLIYLGRIGDLSMGGYLPEQGAL